MPHWLLDRLSEKDDHPKPRFAVQGTLNWMRALALLIDSAEFTNASLAESYSDVARRAPNRPADTATFECLLMAVHNVAALTSFNANIPDRYNVVRSAVVSWYYSIYAATSAMVLSTSGANAEVHRKVANEWHSDIIQSGAARGPFGLALSTLMASETARQVAAFRQGSNFTLDLVPTNKNQARGAVCSYLSGTAEYERWRTEERIMASREFKSLGRSDFRTKAARMLRDESLAKGYVNFLTQAFRYRGKANYRDSVYLSYGASHAAGINRFTLDLEAVASAFVRMAANYARRRVEEGTWEGFVTDLQQNARITFDAESVGIIV